MKGNKALQVSKIKSYARRMTDNRRDVPKVRPDDKRHMIYTKRRCGHTQCVSLQNIKKSGTDAVAPMPDVYSKIFITQDRRRITPRCLI
jgi:hypothetical protein